MLFSLAVLRCILKVVREIFAEATALREKHRDGDPHFEW
jgi:hypothetical protein